MSGDKDNEGQQPENESGQNPAENTEGFPSDQEQQSAAESGAPPRNVEPPPEDDGFDDMPEEPQADVFATDDGFGEEDDFVEEDWESYDDEDFLDDGDGEAPPPSSAFTFNRIVMGLAVIGAVAVGGYAMFGGEEENLGQPDIQQVGKTVPVSEEQRVEFHTDTKVGNSRDAFGVTYGEQQDTQEEEEDAENNMSGVLNNPEMVDEIRSRGNLGEVDYSEGGIQEHVYDEGEGEELPQPAPMMTRARPGDGAVDNGGDETAGLMPMPRSFDDRGQNTLPEGAEEPSPLSAGLPDANRIERQPRIPQDSELSDIRVVDGGLNSGTLDPSGNAERDSGENRNMAQNMGQDMARNTGAQNEAVSDKLDMITSRLERMESSLNDKMENLESRIAKLEKQPQRSASRASSSTTSSAPRSTARRPTPAPSWELKSAQPGMAMVSRQGHSDTLQVAVGESLSGIGRITAIDMVNGQWVVQGTNGKISQ